MSLPAPLVNALMNDRGFMTSSNPEYAVGALPRGYPMTLVPSGPVRIVGGMTSGDEIIAVFADSTRRLAAVLEQMFQQAGFTRPKPSPGSGFMSGSGPYSFFCKDSATVSAQELTGSTRNLVRVNYRRPRGFSACPTFERASSRAELPLPELRPPSGVYVRGSHGSTDSDGVNSSAEMTGMSLIPSMILAHYAAQLVGAGWAAAAPAISERVAAQFFEAKTASGDRWEGVLMAVGGGSAMTLSLTMHHGANP